MRLPPQQPYPYGSGHPPLPSPGFYQPGQRSGGPPAYSTNDAMAHAASQAYAIAQQQMYLVAQQQRLNQQSLAYQGGNGQGIPMLGYGIVHPGHPHPGHSGPATPGMVYGNGSPALGVGQLGRSTSYGFGVNGGSQPPPIPLPGPDEVGLGAKGETERLREQLASLQRKSKRGEIENERKNKELEIALWRLECVNVERKAEDRQVRAEPIPRIFIRSADRPRRRPRKPSASLSKRLSRRRRRSRSSRAAWASRASPRIRLQPRPHLPRP
jgi:hypothetical protein